VLLYPSLSDSFVYNRETQTARINRGVSLRYLPKKRKKLPGKEILNPFPSQKKTLPQK